MYGNDVSVELLRQEFEERLKNAQQDQFARRLAGRSTTVDFLFEKLGDLLIATGNRLQAYAGKAPRPFEQVRSSVAR